MKMEINAIFTYTAVVNQVASTVTISTPIGNLHLKLDSNHAQQYVTISPLQR